MLRFCDREVSCVYLNQIDRNTILKYFLFGHMDDEIFVADDESGIIGKITYHSLMECEDINRAIINEEFLFLNKSIWESSKKYFGKNYFQNGQTLIPVLDVSKKLVCFAYNADGNRQIRMLRELLELGKEAKQFSDIFPQFKCVKIFGFNELAYFFAYYLKEQKIPVLVEGDMWKYFFEESHFTCKDYECLNVYAEGIEKKQQDWKESLIRSVAAEFDCIDQIYEINLKEGIIKNAIYDKLSFIDNLKNKNEIIIIGTGLEAQDAYDYLLENNIDICCFMSNVTEKSKHKLFGKNIECFLDIKINYRNPVFIECKSKKSAWGFGRTDDFDYVGYKRNINYFLLKDYVKIKPKGLSNVLKGKEVVLLGDYDLCCQICNILLQNNIFVIGWINILHKTVLNIKEKVEFSIENIDCDVLCLIVLPEYFDEKGIQQYHNKKNELIEYLKHKKLLNYTDYFSFMTSWIHLNGAYREQKYISELRPKRIVIGAMAGSCGNSLFRGVLDNHPNILLIEYSYLNNNLFWICNKLANIRAADVLSMFWKIYNDLKLTCICNEETELINPQVFNNKMKELLLIKNNYTAQELFVMIHIAYNEMYRQNITDINEIIIYWEPHMIYRDVVVRCLEWIKDRFVKCEIVDIRRNVCSKIGSNIKGLLKSMNNGNTTYLYDPIFHSQFLGEDGFENSRFSIRFEDLKCFPRMVMHEICDRWCIDWSENFLSVTKHGKRVGYDNGRKMIKDFELEPVYNLYEDYFSDFDRFRLMIYYSVEQQMFNYPYIDIKQFTMRDLEQMFIKSFRIEKLVKYSDVKQELLIRIRLMECIREKILQIRSICLLDDYK